VRWKLGLVVAVTAGLVAAYAVALPSREVSTRFRSVALAGDVHATVVLPPGYDTSGKRYPVVYFLHGLPAPPTAYQDVGWLEDALARVGRPAILVQPQGARAGESDPEYLDWGKGRDWEGYIANEVPAYVDAHFRTIRSRYGRALVGLSAGGYGAVALGFNHVDRFAVIESWSGYFHPTDPTGVHPLATAARNNVHTLIGRFRAYQQRHGTLFAFYVGRGDGRFRAENEQLDRELDAAGVPHIFQLYPGAHGADVWRRHAVAWLRLALLRLALVVS
jgi:putative tributyrin esterase